MITCRQCEQEINQATEICPHCGADLTQTAGGVPIAGKKLSVRQILLRWGTLVVVLLGTMWGFLWFVVTPRAGHQKLEAETTAVQALGELQTVLASYAAAQGGAYPSTLEPLGPQARLAAQMAQGEGYELRYLPGPPGPDGAIHSFSIEARASNYGYRNFYSDSSGIVRATSDNRAANGLDPPIR